MWPASFSTSRLNAALEIGFVSPWRNALPLAGFFPEESADRCFGARCAGSPRLGARSPWLARSRDETRHNEPQRTAEAVRRELPDLLRLSRYESRAATRRDRAIRSIAKRAVFKTTP